MGLVIFFFLAAVCVASVLAMIISRNQAYSALYLVLAFAALGGLFGLLDAPFIAAVQIIIYAGAIMVLFIFVIMLVNLQRGIPPARKKWAGILASALAVVLLAELLLAVQSTLFELGRSGGEKIGRPATLGRLLFTEFLYPFEITSILIVAALVGAIVLAKKERAAE
jgi:NADH-quinone oxidoreductase subunit J